MEAPMFCKRIRYSSRCRALHFTACILLLTATGTAQAVEWRGVVKAGYDFGGDTLQTVRFADGTTESIKANDGFYFGGGIALVPAASNFETQLTLAWKYTGVTANNGEISFTRYPLEALAFYNWDFFRVGGGLTYHINPKLKRSGVVSGGGVDFNSRVGAIVQADYRVTENVTAGIRYTYITYTGDGRDIHGDGFGVAISGSF